MKLYKSIKDLYQMEDVAFYDYFYIHDVLQTTHDCELATRIIDKFAQILQLEFSDETIYTNVCHFNHHRELRDEFKVSFSFKDICNYFGGYLLARHHQSKSLLNNFDSIIIPCPVNQDVFWKCARYYSDYIKNP
jgi:hypothetical protein